MILRPEEVKVRLEVVAEALGELDSRGFSRAVPTEVGTALSEAEAALQRAIDALKE